MHPFTMKLQERIEEAEADYRRFLSDSSWIGLRGHDLTQALIALAAVETRYRTLKDVWKLATGQEWDG